MDRVGIAPLSGGLHADVRLTSHDPQWNDEKGAALRHDQSEPQRGDGGAGGGVLPDLRPSKEVLERAAGGGSVDHLEDVGTPVTGCHNPQVSHTTMVPTFRMLVNPAAALGRSADDGARFLGAALIALGGTEL